LSLSSLPPSIWRNSRSSISLTAMSNCVSRSDCSASPVSKNSCRTVKSLSSSSAFWYLVTQRFFSWISLRISSAFFGSSQKPGACVFSSSSSTSYFFLSMSKVPPQGTQPLIQIFQPFGSKHKYCLFVR